MEVKYTDIPLNEFLEAIEITLNSTYFVYNNIFYKQIDGCAMGALIPSNIAQLVLEDLEESVIPNLNLDLTFFYRYVNDCITATLKDNINYILNSFNNYHPKL